MRIPSTMTFVILLIINISGSSFIKLNIGEGEKLYFETIRKDYYSSHINKSDYTIDTHQEWENLWNLTFSNFDSMPTINFTENTIIASYLGRKPTGGYSIEIIGILENSDQVNVYVGEKYPSEGMGTTQLVTHPFHIVKTEKITKTIIFKHFIVDTIGSFNISLTILFSISAICGIIFYIRLKKIKSR